IEFYRGTEMSKSGSIRELADALKELFQAKRGEFRLDDLIEVCRVFGQGYIADVSQKYLKRIVL
ncbi:MAG: hypothetical protein ABIF87_01320, partial [Pseudomonadota bacterium]